MAFAPIDPEPASRIEPIQAGEHRWVVHRDLETDESVLEIIENEGRYRLRDIDLEVTDDTREWYRYQGDDFSSVTGELLSIRRLAREGWDVYTRTVLTADSEDFHLHAELDAYENGRCVYPRNWARRIPRQLV